jgi:hypothetical protein
MKRALAACGALAAVTLLAAFPAGAGEHRRAPTLPAYAQECGACHVPFPSRMLPAPSWQRIMQGLSRHYGADASLDPAVRDSIAAWLDANAGKGKYADPSPPGDRITRSTAFIRKHREVPRDAWSRPAVTRPSNCGACHPRAGEGAFSEHDVRIPR